MRFGNLFAEARFQMTGLRINLITRAIHSTVFITSLRFSLFVDSQNDYPYPTEGFLVKSYYETAQSTLGGDIAIQNSCSIIKTFSAQALFILSPYEVLSAMAIKLCR